MPPKFYWALIIGFYLSFMVPFGHADTTGVETIYRLYKNYGWVAFMGSDRDVSRYMGKDITQQKRKKLEQYFDSPLATLFIQESKCLTQNKGELCNLEFDPIFASQDPNANDLEIRQAANQIVRVSFLDPSSSEKKVLNYRMVKLKIGWRIADIIYETQGGISLKAILSKHLVKTQEK